MTLHQYFQFHSMTLSAKNLGVSVSLMSLWTSGKRKVPISRCLAIERLTGGMVKIEVLRADHNWQRSTGLF